MIDISAIISAILGFLGGFLSFAAGSHLYRTNWRYKIRTRKAVRKLQKAYTTQNREQSKKLGFLLQVLKLYSPNIIEQGMAIEQLVVFGDKRSFEILVERLGSRPDLHPANRATLLSALRTLVALR